MPGTISTDTSVSDTPASDKRPRTKDAALRARAQKVIPNGMYGHQSVGRLPANTPQFFSRAKGAYLWDVDDNRYIDLMCGYGPNLLGYGHAEIDQVYKDQLDKVDAATGPTAHIVELAEAFCDTITHADWAIFCKNGTDATSMALMTARAYRSKNKILMAKGAYHGAATWCNPAPAGAVSEDRAHIIYYTYNDATSLQQAADEAGDDLAGIFASPFKHDVMVNQELPELEYAQKAREICDAKDALLIVDDIRAGFRIHRDCSWASLNVQPDLSTWGKAIANGHPLSCLVGNDRSREGAEKLYVTGSYWFAGAAMAASVKTLEIIRNTDYLEHTIALGDQLRTGLNDISNRYSLDISQTGPSQMPLIMFDGENGKRNMELGTNFTNGMLERGVYVHLFHNMFISAAMTSSDIEFVLDAADDVSKQVKNTHAAQS